MPRSDRNLYLAADGKTMTEEGDPKSHKLLVAEGHDLDGKRAAELGIIDDGGKLRQVEVKAPAVLAKPDPKPGPKS